MACWVNPDGTIQCSDLNLSAATITPIAAVFGQHAKDSNLVTPNQAAQLQTVTQKLAGMGAGAVVVVFEPGEVPSSL